MTPLGLYIHVPFCRSKCDWCSFTSETGTQNAELWLLRTLQQLLHPPVSDPQWATVYLGGGTPSLLNPEQLGRLLEAVGRDLQLGAEVTLEANPESLTADHLDVFSARGGTRLSLGIQTFQDNILERHGRLTRFRDIDRARSLTQGWPGQVSLDLMCGLSGQTAEGQRNDLERAIGWAPDHISFYSLTLEPGTPLANHRSRYSRLPRTEDAELWWLDGREVLEGRGYLAYEVSNFARPGAESKHNGRYWNLDPWWGLGPSAVSFLPLSGTWTYQTEPQAVEQWLSGLAPSTEIPTALELAKDRLLAGMRRREGVSAFPWAGLLETTLGAWEGRLLQENGRLFLSQETFPFLDTFLREAFAELDGRAEFR